MVTLLKKYRVPRMNLKVKGLLKGWRCISQVFGHEEEKVEMRISFPTDVKHITHLGYVNGDSATSPSWMNEFKQVNGGVESDILQAITRSIEVLTEESGVSSSRRVIVKTKLGKDSKPPGTRRRKRAPGDPEAKPKKTRRRRKKKVVKDGSATSIASSTKTISSKAACVPKTEGEGGLDRVKSGAMYMSAHESSDIKGSPVSYCTVASGWGRDGVEDGENLEGCVLLV